MAEILQQVAEDPIEDGEGPRPDPEDGMGHRPGNACDTSISKAMFSMSNVLLRSPGVGHA